MEDQPNKNENKNLIKAFWARLKSKGCFIIMETLEHEIIMFIFMLLKTQHEKTKNRTKSEKVNYFKCFKHYQPLLFGVFRRNQKTPSIEKSISSVSEPEVSNLSYDENVSVKRKPYCLPIYLVIDYTDRVRICSFTAWYLPSDCNSEICIAYGK